MHRTETRGSRALGAVVDVAGRALGFAARRVTSLPGIGGAILIAVGAGQVYRPAFLIVLGAFGLMLDRRLP